MNNDNLDMKNLILAVVLSFIAISFVNKYIAPPTSKNIEQQASNKTADNNKIISSNEEMGIKEQISKTESFKLLSRQEALSSDPRIKIQSSNLEGSIRLQGARFDDLILSKYKQGLDATSPDVELLSPSNTQNAYFANLGWKAAQKEEKIKLPSSNTLWQISKDSPKTLTPAMPITLEWDNGEGLKFSRTISLDENYMFSITENIENYGKDKLSLMPFGLISKAGKPAKNFYISHEGPIGVLGETLKEIKNSDLEKKAGEKESFETLDGWIGITDKYWLTALIFAPSSENKILGSFVYNKIGEQDRFQADYISPSIELPQGKEISVTTRFFAGAKKIELLDKYAKQYNIRMFDKAIDFGWYYFLTKPLTYILDYLHGLLGNMGLAILALAFMVRALLFPLANKSYANMSKMKLLQPKMKMLQEKFAEDRVKLNQAVMELYRKEKVNPAAGCLPMLLQIPVFFSLYKVLYISIEMRQAPFYGWIKDLSAPDPSSILTLFGLFPWDVPNVINIGIWPLIMGLTMFIQQKLNPAPADKTQEKIMLMLPIIFTFTMGGFAAGLVIYWSWSNLLSIIQQKMIMRKYGA